MIASQVSFCLEDLITHARAKSRLHFLEDPDGVGSTSSRPFIKKFMAKKWCTFCSYGRGVCLGSACMGVAGRRDLSTEADERMAVGNSPVSIIPGLVEGKPDMSSKKTSSVGSMMRIAALKYPCFIPPVKVVIISSQKKESKSRTPSSSQGGIKV